MQIARNSFIQAVKADLVGPAAGESEILDKARPSDRYLTGILSPEQSEDAQNEKTAEDDDDRDEASEDDSGADNPVPMNSMRRPTSMGVSFALRGSALRLEMKAARYRRRWRQGDQVTSTEGDRGQECWIREPLSFSRDVELAEGLHSYPACAGLQWWVRGTGMGGTRQVTVVLENTHLPVLGRIEFEESAFFQTELRIRAGAGSSLTPRKLTRQRRGTTVDRDLESGLLIYRNMEEWAVGHNCGATWGKDESGQYVEGTWLPEQLVPTMSADGHEILGQESERVTGTRQGAFLASKLATASKATLIAMLEVLPSAYEWWIAKERARSEQLDPSLVPCARLHLDDASRTADRIRTSIRLVAENERALRAFQLAQKAMLIQRRWTTGLEDEELRWRPFQLAFQLLALQGLVEPGENGKPSVERSLMDLLWFPTGGGKTEAYLGLIAFLLIYRRLRYKDKPDDGAGVAAIMRYTLRLLTIQQFERASRMVLACEFLRRLAVKQGDLSLGSAAFGIGLWVGGEATPNKLEHARSSPDEARKARQLARCPACRDTRLVWDRAGVGIAYTVECENQSCPLTGQTLPVFTIDEVIYRERPSLVIGTVDKFAQIVRNPGTDGLLGKGGPSPDLILQDELHLISGPLGTIVGLYEAAIDRICARDGIPPKIIGSTATIRRAEEQVRGLFDRSVAHFPPPGIDWEDSCFAVKDESVPGRVYVGVTTAGRSPKFTLQAVCGAAMQRVAPSEGIFLDDESRDPYWTLLAYFNSMRELGGALVMMIDDVNDSMEVYARSHGKTVREKIDEPLELTSRVPSSEIPDILARLERRLPEQDISVVLATNMISVGIDIPRLGLMVINGQPKSMAEYIQASSRIGRNQIPGLIFTVYNAGRARDRAHYESFRTWHQSLYRDVEATSVTPFAPRARDKALHAAVVALARHLVSDMRDDPELTDVRREALEQYTHALYERAIHVDQGEADETRQQISSILDCWARRGPIANYWAEYKPAESLLVSAERVAEYRAAQGEWNLPALSTPNSMRDVEPSVSFRLTSVLSQNSSARQEGPDDGEQAS